jgi:hypothetical protein
MEPRPVGEIVALHAEFERWLRGEGERDRSRIEAALSPALTFVSPRGDVVTRDGILKNMQAGWGARHLRIRIENPEVHWTTGAMILATYEEWHDHEAYTTGRQSSVVFEVDPEGPNGVRWRHVQETWIQPPPRR